MHKHNKKKAFQACSTLLLAATTHAAVAEMGPQFRPMEPPPWAQQQQQQAPSPQFAPPDYRRPAPPPQYSAPPARPQAYGPPPGYQQRPAPQPMPQQGPYAAPPGYGAYPPPPPPPYYRGRSRNWSDGPSGWFGNNRRGGNWFNGQRQPWRGDNPWDFIDMDDPKESMSRGWDDMLNAPSRMGEMPGGWYAPSVSVPNPVDVTEELGDAARDMPDQIDNMRSD